MLCVFVVCLFVVWRVSFVALVVCCLLCVVRCLSSIVHCPLFVVCSCLLLFFGVRCALVRVRCNV